MLQHSQDQAQKKRLEIAAKAGAAYFVAKAMGGLRAQTTENINKQHPDNVGDDAGATTADRAPRSRDLAAQDLKVSARYIDYAEKIKETDPELFEDVAAGKKTIAQAWRDPR